MSRTPQNGKKAVASLKKEEAEIQKRLSQVRETLDRLDQITMLTGSTSTRRKPQKASRRLSSKGREAISRAAKKRWAAYRKEQRQAR